MPAKSKKQQMAAGAALAAKRGDTPKSSLKGASKQMAESMSETELKEDGQREAQEAAQARRESRKVGGRLSAPTRAGDGCRRVLRRRSTRPAR
jgi:hypothetical protein